MTTMSDVKIYPPIQKTVKRAFGKEVYLLGRFKDGYTFWLEEPKWDCGWYWAFGYIETYTQKEGPPAKDIQRHQHYDSLLFKKHERYDFDKQAFVLDNNYMHILSDHPDVLLTVLTKEEQWKLSDLMKMAYTLKATAELYRRGNAYLTTHGMTPGLKRPEREKEINEIELPQIFAAMKTLLTPQE